MSEVSDSTSASIVSRTRSSPAGKNSSPAAARGPGMGATLVWLALMAVPVLALVPVLRTAADGLGEYALVHADPLVIEQALDAPLPADASAGYLEGLAEFAVMARPERTDTALSAVHAALALDDQRPFALAMLAYLVTSQEGEVSEEALGALSRSMDICGVCSADLVRWRFNFVLTNWQAIPEEMRRRAFEHADILRWTGNNAEFLAEMRVKANAAGIPFDTYRSEVNTPVRSWDIGVTSEPVR